MVRIVMLGRLGNNLFQYAMGRVLADRHGVPLVMDGSWFNREGWDQVKCIKRLPGLREGKAQVVRRCSLGARLLLKATGRHYWEYRGVPVLRESESDQSFDPRFLQAPADCMLFGYFQTPLYFESIEASLRQELSTHDLGLEDGHERLAEQLRAPGSVAIHVRRTDYTGNPNLDICDPGYYAKAMEHMRSGMESPRFHVFSDEPSWCRRHFTSSDTTVIEPDPSSSPLTYLHLMSLAGNHIIANSSYSWWAAWLGKKSGQQVLMPPVWFEKTLAPIGEKQAAGWKPVG
ncbi:alpha-1,2-fucosyltransferase [Luteolibacter yonseiensis]|uniref:Alpha-1,2-fucosyltransferase n=1 Tax=Luteolibacter yonseiensis TaxID=1144680 RepID=A0A934R1H1_9BACT|nr:alpha-1,2-fucosyltransferase [Luteolibacter yonseiensis]MBK1814408.1 alpha-1,2-fucosyltransferase [Luteolibacter yonseiensis]